MAAAAEEQRWKALVSRDRTWDADFVYAVVTTGVYCRPSCTTSTPLRRNVRFFPNWAAANAAGFAPCKRCRPDLQSALTPQTEAVIRACAALHQGKHAPVLNELATKVGVSRFHLHRTFKKTLGVTPGEYAEELRWKRLSTLLTLGYSVSDAIYQAGFGAVSRAYEKAKFNLGMTPAAWRSGGVGAAIWYAIVESDSECVLVAGTDSGICMIAEDKSLSALLQILKSCLPSASACWRDGKREAWIIQAVEQNNPRHLMSNIPAEYESVAFSARLRKRILNARIDGPLALHANLSRLRLDRSSLPLSCP
ncbi:bifunctional transcriptional activator/DNA repair enzyme AdaA [Hyphococcus luteus]|uniref:Bifunctional transcriptional activator/DNA repair enzyme protein Ada n=1 Tax=Hyphococcus luteus TaxID=2058213 RepID=A0A2S7KB04_9PROT|nr:Ada metal-binding domain-containing protein [Marinicaulis flavus]PQA89692.1 bifunctional transcriptional activator/DNA repair enzyme protein Ada [Marinicaulis flavus]